MKKIFFVAVLATCSAFTANAQVHVNVNIGSQPVWGPVGYDYVEYYYLPDADAYYDVNNSVFVYFDGRGWIRGRSLPGGTMDLDLYHVHKVIINERDPWMHHDRYHREYINYAGRCDQVIIRDSRDQRYWQNPGHPHYNEWRMEHGNRGHGNDNRGHENDNRGRGNDNNGRGHEDHGHGNEHGHGRGR